MKIIKVDPLNPQDEIIKEAAGVLKNAGLVIIPTDTVYGIAADATNIEALKKLSEIKNRSKDKPFALLIAGRDKAEELAVDIPVAAYKLMGKFWPGPLTIILKDKNGGKVGLRMPDNQIALKIIAQTGVPLACPSANLSGKVAPKSFQEAASDLGAQVELAVDGGDCKTGLESSVADLSNNSIQVLRESAVKKEDIEAAAKKQAILFVCTGNTCRSVIAKALLEKKLKEKNRSDVELLSAGIMMFDGLSASEGTRQVLAKEGMDVSGHRSQRVTKEMLRRSDIILVMEKLQEDIILELAPDTKNRLFLLKEFAKIEDTSLDIKDPIGRDEDFYEYTFSVIKEAVQRVSETI